MKSTVSRIILKDKGEVNCLNLLITALRQDNLYTEMTLEFENGQNYNFGVRGEDISKQRWVEGHLSKLLVRLPTSKTLTCTKTLTEHKNAYLLLVSLPPRKRLPISKTLTCLPNALWTQTIVMPELQGSFFPLLCTKTQNV